MRVAMLALLAAGCAGGTIENPALPSPGSANTQTLSGAGQTLSSPGERGRESFAGDVLARAQKWVDLGLMYSWTPNWNGYRTDCSGLVSYAWGLPAPGHTTYSLAGGPWADGASYVITWDDLAPGDALNFPGDWQAGTGHVMLFAGWDNRAAGTFFVYEEYTWGRPAEYRRHNLNEYWGTRIGDYLPIRSAFRPDWDAPPKDPPDTGGGGERECPSTTLGANVASGTCVQSALDGVFYQCMNGEWAGYEGGREGPGGACGTYYAYCHSDTRGADLPARTCVQSKFDNAWYQCGDGGEWQSAGSAPSTGSGPLGACAKMYGL